MTLCVRLSDTGLSFAAIDTHTLSSPRLLGARKETKLIERSNALAHSTLAAACSCIDPVIDQSGLGEGPQFRMVLEMPQERLDGLNLFLRQQFEL